MEWLCGGRGKGEGQLFHLHPLLTPMNARLIFGICCYNTNVVFIQSQCNDLVYQFFTETALRRPHVCRLLLLQNLKLP